MNTNEKVRGLPAKIPRTTCSLEKRNTLKSPRKRRIFIHSKELNYSIPKKENIKRETFIIHLTKGRESSEVQSFPLLTALRMKVICQCSQTFRKFRTSGNLSRNQGSKGDQNH